MSTPPAAPQHEESISGEPPITTGATTSSSASAPVVMEDASLPRSDTDMQCPICYEPCFDRVEAYPCRHVFCYQCIMVWALEPSGLCCPNCRRNINYFHHSNTATGRNALLVVTNPDELDEEANTDFDMETYSQYFADWVRQQGPQWPLEYDENLSGQT
jgi:hypothetical protein